MLFIHICILNSYVNLCQNQSCQFQNPTVLSTSNFSSPFKFKLLQSCQVNFNLFSSIQFVFVNGQVASSHPRTACARQFVSVNGEVASSHPRTACACQFTLVIGQAASSNPGTACTCALFLPSAKWLVQIQEQLVLPTFLSAK